MSSNVIGSATCSRIIRMTRATTATRDSMVPGRQQVRGAPAGASLGCSSCPIAASARLFGRRSPAAPLCMAFLLGDPEVAAVEVDQWLSFAPPTSALDLPDEDRMVAAV